MIVWDCCPGPWSPLCVSTNIKHEVHHVALPWAVDVAVVVVRIGVLWTVVAVVFTPLICVTGIQASPVAVYRDQVVSGNTSAPAMSDLIETKKLLCYLRKLKSFGASNYQLLYSYPLQYTGTIRFLVIPSWSWVRNWESSTSCNGG